MVVLAPRYSPVFQTGLRKSLDDAANGRTQQIPSPSGVEMGFRAPSATDVGQAESLVNLVLSSSSTEKRNLLRTPSFKDVNEPPSCNGGLLSSGSNTRNFDNEQVARGCDHNAIDLDSEEITQKATRREPSQSYESKRRARRSKTDCHTITSWANVGVMERLTKRFGLRNDLKSDELLPESTSTPHTTEEGRSVEVGAVMDHVGISPRDNVQSLLRSTSNRAKGRAARRSKTDCRTINNWATEGAIDIIPLNDDSVVSFQKQSCDKSQSDRTINSDASQSVNGQELSSRNASDLHKHSQKQGGNNRATRRSKTDCNTISNWASAGVMERLTKRFGLRNEGHSDVILLPERQFIDCCSSPTESTCSAKDEFAKDDAKVISSHARLPSLQCNRSKGRTTRRSKTDCRMINNWATAGAIDVMSLNDDCFDPSQLSEISEIDRSCHSSPFPYHGNPALSSRSYNRALNAVSAEEQSMQQGLRLTSLSSHERLHSVTGDSRHFSSNRLSVSIERTLRFALDCTQPNISEPRQSVFDSRIARKARDSEEDLSAASFDLTDFNKSEADLAGDEYSDIGVHDTYLQLCLPPLDGNGRQKKLLSPEVKGDSDLVVVACSV